MSHSSTSSTKWQPQTSFYDYNYGIGIGFYQPMIDYLEEKDLGVQRQLPHLPWTNERGLDQYDPKKAIRSYSEHDLTRISRRTEASAKEKLRDFKSTSKSSFMLSQSVSAANITQKLSRRELRKKKAILTDIKKLKSKMEDINFHPYADDKEIEEELKRDQKLYRGKSAKAIEVQLLSKSRRSVTERVEKKNVRQLQNQLLLGTISKHDFVGHLEFMDKRMQKQLEESITVPLESLSTELKCFDRRSTNYFIDQR